MKGKKKKKDILQIHQKAITNQIKKQKIKDNRAFQNLIILHHIKKIKKESIDHQEIIKKNTILKESFIFL